MKERCIIFIIGLFAGALGIILLHDLNDIPDCTPSHLTDEAYRGTMPHYIIDDANRLEIK